MHPPEEKELLEQIGLTFTIIPCHAPEIITKVDPAEVVLELSGQKAEAVAEEVAEKVAEEVLLNRTGTAPAVDSIVIGADTIVSVDGQILGKPKDEEDAFRMLSLLQGRAHQVYTGVTLLHVTEKDVSEKEHGIYRIDSFAEKTDVVFYPMDEASIRDYIATGDPMDKAGAYGIQGICARYIQEIRGDYNNVVGLPAGRVYQSLLANECLTEKKQK